MKYHYIYKTTNNITGSYYIGRHSTKNLNDGYIGSGKRFKALVDQYGRENFTTEILEYCNDYDELKTREFQIVNEDLLKDPLCVNMKLGGDGGWDFINQNGLGLRTGKTLSAISRKKISEKKSGCKLSEDHKNKLKMNNGMKSDLAKERVSKALTGKKKTEDHKENISRAISEWHKERRTNVNSDFAKGSKNSNFGKMYIHNPEFRLNKTILKTEEIPDGWVKGRKISYHKK